MASFSLLLFVLLAAHGAAPVLGFTRSDFPPDFVFGAATSAYQYEGAVAEDGRSPSIWDTFTHAGKIADKSTGDIASDGYHKYKLMAKTNLEAYRFSISWSRLIPDGRGAVNPKGLEYYNNLIDELVKHATKRYQDFMFGWTLEPLVFGDYPQVMKTNVGSRLPSFTKSQSEFVKGAIDFIGINHYYSVYVNDRPLKEGVRNYAADMSVNQRGSRTDPATSEYLPSAYPNDPDGLQFVLQYLTETYGGLPIYVQENGKVSSNDTLDDTDRVEYLKSYIGGTLTALRNGANVKGYFAWNFLDIFEFLGGYKSGYGLHRVDFDDEARPRQARLSARWYSGFLKDNGIYVRSELGSKGSHAQQ